MRYFLIACVLAVSAAPAAAQDGPPTLPVDAGVLARYDLIGERSTDAIRELEEALHHAHGHRWTRDVRFVRSVLAADLLILAHLHSDEALAARTASAYEVRDQASLVHLLRAEMANTQVTHLAETRNDVLRALDHISGRATVNAAMPPGERRDALLVHEAWQRMQRTTLDVDSLWSLGADPCASGRSCPEPYGRFVARGRSAMYAAVAVQQALRRLEAAAVGGDPFALAITHEVAVDGAIFASLDLQPMVAATEGLRLSSVDTQRSAPGVDLVLSVSEGEVRYGFVPSVRVQHGVARAIAVGEPMLPRTRPIAIPSHFGAYPRRITPLVARLREIAPPGTRVGLGGAWDVPAHVAVRVLRSARSAGFDARHLMAVGADGAAQAIPFQAIDRDADGFRTRVFVRMGGYSVTGRGRVDSIPRVHQADGWHFDPGALDRALQTRASSRVGLRFMRDVALGTLVEACFVSLPRHRELGLVLP